MDFLRKLLAVSILFLFSQAALAILAVDDSYVIVQGESRFYSVLNNDSYASESLVFPTNDDIQIVQGDVDPQTLNFSIEGLYLEPTPGYVGVIELVYTITDDSGSSEASVVINVEEGGQQVQALNDSFAIPVNSGSVHFFPLENDRYAETTILASVSTPDHGTASVDGSVVYYEPPADFSGIDTFSYTLEDSELGALETAVVTVYVGTEPGSEDPVPPEDNPPPEDTPPPEDNTPPEEGEENEFTHIPSLSREEQATYHAIVAICTSGEDTHLPCDEIAQLDDRQTQQLLQQISGQHAKLQGRNMLETRGQQSTNVRTRLGEIRSGSNQVSVNSLNASLFGKSVPLTAALQRELNDTLGGGASGDDISTPWGAFVNGKINVGEGKRRNDRPDYEQDGYNITMGLDYRLSDTMVAGVAAGFSQSDLDFSRDLGTQESSSYSLSLFGNYYPSKRLYLDGLLMYIDGTLDVERRVEVSSIAAQLASSTDSQQLVLSTSLGYEFSFQRFQSSIYGRLEYSDLSIDAYQEKGSMFALAIDEQETNSFDVALGGRAGYVFNLNRGVVVPTLELEYVSRNEDDYTIEGRFMDAPLAPQFSLQAEEQDTEYMNASLSVSAVMSGGRSGFFRYETMLMQDDYDLSSYQLGFRMEF